MDECKTAAVSASEFRNDLLNFANQVDELAEEIISNFPNLKHYDAKYITEGHRNFQKSCAKKLEDIDLFIQTFCNEDCHTMIECSYRKCMKERINSLKKRIENAKINEKLTTGIPYEFVNLLLYSKLNEDVKKNFKIMKFTPNPLEEHTSFDRYQAIARAVQSQSDPGNTRFMQSFNETLDSFTKDKDYMTEVCGKIPFLAIIGPQYSGKTQMAFTLASSGFNVVYCNFGSFSTSNTIQKSFSSISETLEKHLRNDCNDNIDLDHLSVYGLSSPKGCQLKLETIGFVYGLLESTCSITENWMENYMKTKGFVYTSRSMAELREKCEKLRRQFKRPLIFFIDGHENIGKLAVSRLRCILQAAGITCVITTRNRKSDVIVWEMEYSGGAEKYTWCYLFPKLPPVNLAAAVNIVSVPVKDDQNATLLSQFIDEDNELKTDSLLKFMGIFDTISDAKKDELENIFDLIVDQSKTCLQGIVILAFEVLLRILNEINEHTSTSLFESFIDAIKLCILADNPEIKDFNSVFLAITTMSLSHPKYEDGTFDEGFMRKWDENGMFYFGPADTQRESLYKPIKLARNCHSGIYFDNDGKRNRGDNPKFFVENRKIHSSRFFDDIITRIVLWSLMDSAFSIRNEPEWKSTIAERAPKCYASMFIDFAIDMDNTMSFLARLCIGNASHQNLKGETDGVTFFKEFAIQLQISDYDINPEFDIKQPIRSLIVSEFPSNLLQFLKGITVPYLIAQIPKTGLPEYLKKLMNVGICESLSGLDFNISFPVNNHQKGYVACKFSATKRGIDRMCASLYILKAIEKKSPITFLFSQFVSPSVCKSEEFNKFRLDDGMPEPELECEILDKKAKLELDREHFGYVSFKQYLDHLRMDKKKGKNQEFDVNVYSLTYPVDISEFKSPKLLSFETLYEVQGKSPDGVFIILEINTELY